MSHGSQGGVAPTLGAGREVPPFAPTETLESASPGSHRFLADLSSGLNHYYGTRKTHWMQQLDAIQYAKKQVGFGGTVSFVVDWSWYSPGVFTYCSDPEGWVQEVTEVLT